MSRQPLNISKQFFVYVHARSDTGAVFYVGKGKKPPATGGQARHRRYRAGRSQEWLDTVSEAGGFSPHIIGEFDDESEAYWAERAMIKYFGRSCASEGQLINKSTGGKGPATGMKHSDSARERIGAAGRGKKRVFSSEWAQKLRAAAAMRTGLPVVRCRIVHVDGREWFSVSRMAMDLGIHSALVHKAFKDGSALKKYGITRFPKDAP